MRTILITCALLLALSASIQAQAPVQVTGMVQDWITDTEDSTRSTIAHARLKMAGKPGPDTSYSLMVEMAPSKKLNIDAGKMEPTDFLLLDSYVEYAPKSWSGAYVRYGQFKFPFGQDRMPVPQALETVDYSIINRATFPGHDWDLGLGAGLRRKEFNLDVAMINGTGPGTFEDDNSSSDLAAKLEVYSFLPKGSAVGVSYYNGRRFEGSGLGERDWVGMHAKYAATSGKHPILLQGEFINRSDGLDVWTVQGSCRTARKWLWVAKYDRVRPDTGAKKSRLWLGPVFKTSDSTEFTLNWLHDENSVTGSTDSAVFQTQVVF